VDVDKAFVQFAGLTAGRAQSFFDFYAGDLEFIGAGIYSNTNTNLLAYTATFGGGFSATLSMEDPATVERRLRAGCHRWHGPRGWRSRCSERHQLPVRCGSCRGGRLSVRCSWSAVTALNLDVAQRTRLPDFVGVLRYDGAWGSAQVMGAVHEINTGKFVGTAGFATGIVPVGAVTVTGARVPNIEYGWAVGGGLKVNLPQLAPGDQLWLQGAYGNGAAAYTGTFNPGGTDTVTSNLDGKFAVTTVDAVVTGRGRLELTETWSVMGAFLHYWNPEWRSGVYAGYGQTNYDPRLRNANFGPAGGTGFVAAPPATLAATNATFRSFDTYYAAGNLIWSPVKDLDIGVEVVYQRYEIANGRVTAAEGRSATATVSDNILARFRVQRDF
jgi:hypothetical protein